MSEKLLGNRYRIQGRIGIGGMATVYRGTDTVLGRIVAVKTMLPQYASDPSFAARFKQEAQAAAALQSPYIVGIFDWGQDGNTYYIVMEYLKGTDLKTGIKEHGALDPRKVAQIGSQICQALSVAHKHDIVHRDIKPQNIMVQLDGNIKVMDFGIARAKNSHLTQDNSVLGTAHYVSPEQTQGKPLGPTSDIYSLGIVMYEAAVGKVPFQGDDAIAVALKQVNDAPVPPSQINPAVDAQLEAIILKCLEKDPQNRFQSADALRRALADYLAGRKVMLPEATSMMSPVAQTRMIARPQSSSPNQTNNLRAAPTSSHSLYAQEPPKKKKGGKKIALIICAILLALAAAGTALWFAFGQNSATQAVPNYVGMTQEDAINAIKSTDFFKVGTIRQEYSDSVSENQVISQDPQAFSMRAKDTSVSLVISKGKEPPKDVSVPDVSGMSASDADAAIRRAGLTPQADSTQSDSVASGKVARQSPSAGSTAQEGDTVTYYISTGSDKQSVPEVTGFSEASATAMLERAGFSASVTDHQYSSTVAKGNVIKYSPQGSQAKGTTIYLIISDGPAPNPTPSPSGGGSTGGDTGDDTSGGTTPDSSGGGSSQPDDGGDSSADTGGGTTPDAGSTS